MFSSCWRSIIDDGGDRLKLSAICLRYPHGVEDKCPICRNADTIWAVLHLKNAPIPQVCLSYDCFLHPLRSSSLPMSLRCVDLHIRTYASWGSDFWSSLGAITGFLQVSHFGSTAECHVCIIKAALADVLMKSEIDWTFRAGAFALIDIHMILSQILCLELHECTLLPLLCVTKPR